MSRMRTRLVWIALASLGLLPVAARAADLPEPIRVGPVATEAPCADAKVLGRIQQRFDWAERHTWRTGITMASLENGRPSGHTFAEPGIIRRDFCIADSTLTSGARHAVYFTIEYGQGFASIGNYVDFCVLGLDPWYVHDEACRTVR